MGADLEANKVNSSKNVPEWSTLRYWMPFFDISGHQFGERCLAACKGSPTFLENLCGRADFFGPLWITTTVALEIFVLYIARTTRSIVRTSITTALFGFWGVAFILPAIIWLAINNWDVSEMNVTGVTLAECISLSGYSIITTIPALLTLGFIGGKISDALILLSALYGAFFLYRNIWPIMKASPMVDKDRLGTVMWLWMANHVVIIILTCSLFIRA